MDGLAEALCLPTDGLTSRVDLHRRLVFFLPFFAKLMIDIVLVGAKDVGWYDAQITHRTLGGRGLRLEFAVHFGNAGHELLFLFVCDEGDPMNVCSTLASFEWTLFQRFHVSASPARVKINTTYRITGRQVILFVG